MAKALGKDIHEFYETGWPEGYYVDDQVIEVEDDSGKWILEDGEKYDLDKLGVLAPDGDRSLTHDDTILFSSAFSRWMKKRDTVTLVVTISKARRDEVVAALKELGVRIV